MFKTKKTQFAKGAVAVLLSFGILAGPSAPIVSAASEAIQNEMTDDTTSNEVTSDTTSVVEESVPVENNTANTLTTDNTEVSANYSENTEQPIQTEEAIAPLPENVIEKNQKEVTSSKSMVTPTAVTEKSSETTTKPKAEVENQNVTETSKEVGLPETGEDKTNRITTGIVLASIAATITALGSFINKKN